mmetsp:Transcript_8835/g.10096  ORF Transcript_8835/g.10096 Transcript_8835/m.10096 type:complete len:370 (-) Transcript_8835:50-1159(-)
MVAQLSLPCHIIFVYIYIIYINFLISFLLFDRVEGTGDFIRTSSCHAQTDIKVKISAFTGSCDALTCVTGTDEPDFECPILRKENDLSEWETLATALNFQTVLGQQYYILVQQADDTRGVVWLHFRPPLIPKNDNCADAIGPIPRDLIRISSTSVDASISYVPQGYCGGDGVPSLYPGTWFQVIGTGEKLAIMACSQSNFDGYAFSVYGGGGNCDSLECISGEYDVGIDDNDKCAFGTAEISRPMTKFIFQTIDRSRYYIYVHFARTRADRPTADFRFFVDDGKNGEGSSSGAHIIQSEEEGNKIDGASNGSDGNDGESAENGDNGSDGNASVSNGSGDNEGGESSSVIRSTGYYIYAVLVASWMIMIQ